MKRLFVLLLALAMLLSLLLTGCGKKEKTETAKEENVIDRYYLYIVNNALFCLDAKTGEKKEIGTGMPVYEIYDAMVSETNGHMLMELVTEQDEETGNETSALFLWDGTSADAAWIDTDAALARVNQSMDSVVYAKDQDLYQYRSGVGTEKLFDTFQYVSVSEDLSRTLVTAFSAELPVSGEYETQWVTEKDLIYKETGKEAVKIASISVNACNPSATSDLRLVCYTKGPSYTAMFEAYPVYMWTAQDGEVELPFSATIVKVQSENEIYYLSGQDENEGVDLYYYDGKESHLLAENVVRHLHKMSEYLTYAVLRDGSGMVFCHKGKTVKVSGYACQNKGAYSGISADGKTAYIADDTNWYKVQVQDNGELAVSAWFQGVEYHPRTCSFVGDQLAYKQDDTLYCNGQKVADNFDGRWSVSDNGKLYYVKDGTLYCYENEQSTSLAKVGERSEATSYENNIVIEDEYNIYILKEEAQKMVAQNPQSVLTAKAWRAMPVGNIFTGGAKTGWWYTNLAYDVFVYN